MPWDKRALTLVLLLALNAVNIVYLISWLNTMRSTGGHGVRSEEYSYKGHDYPETLPVKDQVTVSITDKESNHYPFIGLDSDPEWFSLAGIEQGSGYLRLGPDNRIFAVSMFHQMHCLRMINLAISKAPIASPPHLHHCLNYLRQAALCGADISLEADDFEKRDFRNQRIGATHKCKDWRQAYSTMERNYAQWERSKTGH